LIIFLEFVDFGVHVADNKTIYKRITVRNTGSTPAPYRIDYKGEHPIVFAPESAIVQPNSSVSVEVIFSKVQKYFILKIFFRCLY
jgi:hypothetical protein